MNGFDESSSSSAAGGISVIFSVYWNDDPDHFLQAFNSVCQQTRPASEIIIYVDGRVSVRLAQLLTCLSTSTGVRTIWGEKNIGAGLGRHKAIIDSENEIIAIMDSDDISLPDRFEKQLRFMESQNLDVVGGFIEEFESRPGDCKIVREVPLLYSDISKFCKFRCPMNNVTVMFRKEAYFRAGGYSSQRVGEDYLLFYRMIKLGVSMANIPEVLVFVRAGYGMFKRRRGFSYWLAEVAIATVMLRDKRINVFEWVFSIFSRLFFRLLPAAFIRSAYLRFFRRNV